MFIERSNFDIKIPVWPDQEHSGVSVVVNVRFGTRYHDCLSHIMRNASKEMGWPAGIDDKQDAVVFTREMFDNKSHKNKIYLIGAAFVYDNPYKNVKAEHIMSKVWIHPFARRQGLFSRSWDKVTFVYPDIVIMPPLSASMEKLCLKYPQIGKRILTNHVLDKNIQQLTTIKT